jgi:hypothetical protein
VALLLSHAATAGAQHPFASQGPYDARVPTPRSVLGYELGERFTPHHLVMRYLERLAATSPRIRLDTLGHSFEGREVMMVIATSEANQRRLAEIRSDAVRLAYPATVQGSIESVVSRTPAIVWLGHTVHGNEASGLEASLALLYQLAAGQDAETRTILDSVVVLVDPVENPDGHERHAQFTWRMRPFGTSIPTSPAALIHGGDWPGPRTSHYFFDLNRDWFTLSHPETRARMRGFTQWWPHVAADLHEMSTNSTYFFAPPMAPIHKLVHSTVHKWWGVFGDANAAAFDRHGWAYFRREGYDEFYPGYGPSWGIFSGAAGMTYEQASSAGGAIRRTDGTVLTLHDAASHHYTTGFTTALTTARRRTERLRDYVTFRRSAVDEMTRSAARVVVLERDAQGRADSLARRLLQLGIEVGRTRAGTITDAIPYDSRAGAPRFAEGAYVVDFAQPQGRLARVLLEQEAELDSTFIREELENRRTGQGERFYDVTAWALPYTYRVRAWNSRALPEGVQRISESDIPDTAPPAPPAAAFGYAFEAGSESSLRLLAALLADSVKVWYAPRAFRSGSVRFPRGAFVARTVANSERLHSLVSRHASAARARVHAIQSAAADEGTDLGSGSVFPIRSPRVAILGGPPVNGNSFGFSWYALDQRLRYPSTPLDVSAVQNGALSSFDVLVLPSANGLDNALGDGGRERLQRWVRDGGVLITVEASTAWLATERAGLARLRARRDTTRADSSGGAPLPASVPGAIVRATVDTLSPLLAGIWQSEIPVLMNSDRIYTVPRDLRAGEAVIRFAPLPSLRLAGYMWPEVPERLAGSAYLWTERVGRGRIIAFHGDPNFRDQYRGLFPLFANAVLLGGSF